MYPERQMQSYYTTEAEDKFTESASIFLNEAVTVQRIEL